MCVFSFLILLLLSLYYSYYYHLNVYYTGNKGQETVRLGLRPLRALRARAAGPDVRRAPSSATTIIIIIIITPISNSSSIIT